MLLIISEIINVILSVKFFSTLYCASFVITCAYVIIKKDKLRYIEYKYLLDKFYNIGLLFFAFLLIFFSIKLCVARPRPIYVKLGLVENSFSCLSSFPSAHLGLGVMLYLYCVRKKNIWYSLLYVLFLILIGYSRILLGKHYLSDLIGGLILAPVAYVVGAFFIHKSQKYLKTFRLFFYFHYKFLHKKIH